jgi:hypothetical protein
MCSTTPALFIEMGVLLGFRTGYPQTVILPMSTSQIAGIAGHHAQPLILFILMEMKIKM